MMHVPSFQRDSQDSIEGPPKKMDITYVTKDIDGKDVGTPDEWVPRDPRLIRLTGKHPFNCEPPLDLCYDQGFLTPPAIHYVRNHGHCPRCETPQPSYASSDPVNIVVQDCKVVVVVVLASLPVTVLQIVH